MYLIILFVRVIGLFGNLVFHEKPLAPTKPTIWKLLWFDIHGRCDRNATSAPCLICHECFMAFPFFHLTPFFYAKCMATRWLRFLTIEHVHVFLLRCFFPEFSSTHLEWKGASLCQAANRSTTGLELLGCQDQLWWPCDRWQGQTVSSMH